MTPSFKDKLAKTGPRKLLALDGGGIRGVITLGVLAEIEKQLQVQFGRNEDFVLADYFDYIARTSTGAIIGTCLAVGMRVGEVTRFYQESGPEEVRRINAAILVPPNRADGRYSSSSTPRALGSNFSCPQFVNL